MAKKKETPQPEQFFLTEEEFNKLTQVRQANQDIIMELGQINISEIALANRRKAAEQFLEDIKAADRALADELKAAYGDININLDTGEFVKLS
ncbi:hypothetical protein [Pseudomonas sp.]|uniref:hypothetical protein n=1 Tax=Pseudomonas sp. TaxID=306 RepID=UPI00258791E5|nr:hypothetical protein [Pseudomonas sp.]